MGKKVPKVHIADVPKGDGQTPAGKKRSIGHEAEGLPEAAWGPKEAHPIGELHPESLVGQKGFKGDIHLTEFTEHHEEPLPLLFPEDLTGHALADTFGNKPLENNPIDPKLPEEGKERRDLSKVPPVEGHHEDNPERTHHKVLKAFEDFSEHPLSPDGVIHLFHAFKGNLHRGELGKGGKFCHCILLYSQGVRDEHDLKNPRVPREYLKKAKEVLPKEEWFSTGNVEDTEASKVLKVTKEPLRHKEKRPRFSIPECLLVAVAAPEIAEIGHMPLEIKAHRQSGPSAGPSR